MTFPKLSIITILAACGSWGCRQESQPAGVAAVQAARADAEDRVLKSEGFGSPFYLSFSPNQKELARIGMVGHLLSDTSSWTRGRIFDVGIRMVAYSPDGKTLATAEGTDGARVWNMADQGAPPEPPPEIPLEVRVLTKPIAMLLRPAESRRQRVFWTAYSSDGRSLLTADANGHVKIWKTGSWTLESDITRSPDPVRCAAFAPDGRRIAFGDDKGILHVWDLEQKTPVVDLPTESGGFAYVGFSADGKQLVSAHSSGDAMIWKTDDWSNQIERGYRSAAFSKNGKVLALGGSDIRLLASDSLQLIRRIPLTELSQRQAEVRPSDEATDEKIPVVVLSLAWRPDGLQLAAGSLDGSVRLIRINE